MSDTESTVFLEDIDPASSQGAKRKASEIDLHAPSPNAKTKGVVSTTRKTLSQGTLNTFFSSAGAKSSSQLGTKRVKTESGGPATSPGRSINTQQRPKLNSIPFSLSAYQGSLSEGEKDLLRLECECIGLSWLKLLKDEIRKPYFIELKKFLWQAGLKSCSDTPPNLNIYPSAKDVYSWSKTPLGKVKVVIIGQDPYHGAGQAHGLCFSVPVGVRVPPSLVNIYQELKTEYPDFTTPKHGNLTSWANNGVLMLNTCLTVQAGQAGSHSKRGWERFTEKVVEVLDQYGGANLPNGPNGSTSTGAGRGIVFLAWGAWASERVSKLSKSKHLILTSAHPSPYSAEKGFFGNGHFIKANQWLETKYGPEGKVDWCSL
ncbi:uracil-DNA glycosylase [Coprinellus micaceus]|uniref:Uracil-DNA glycosylase n=1 Tax=Coprinellus micaceus TaxID=71717 RepID=A0A4Y7TL86_COPMI|nr:uracil-DNA glycosylase [Coprinellus micaceus]